MAVENPPLAGSVALVGLAWPGLAGRRHRGTVTSRLASEVQCAAMAPQCANGRRHRRGRRGVTGLERHGGLAAWRDYAQGAEGA